VHPRFLLCPLSREQAQGHAVPPRPTCSLSGATLPTVPWVCCPCESVMGVTVSIDHYYLSMYYMHFTMAIFVEHIWPMIFFIFCFLMGPIWSLTVFRCAVFSSWIIYAPWLFWVVPIMCHGSYMIHDYFNICCICYNYLSLTFAMDHTCPMTALNWALYVMGPIWSIITFHSSHLL